MKLTEVSVDSHGICGSPRLQNLAGGLNVVFGPTGSGKSNLVASIRSVLFGFGTDPAREQGVLEALIEGVPCRLTRTLDARGQLTVSDISGSSAVGSRSESLRFAIDQIGPEIFDAVFCGNRLSASQSLRELGVLLHNRLNVPVDRIGLGNQQEFDAARIGAEQRRRQLDSLTHDMASAESQRAAVQRQIEQLQSTRRTRLAELEQRIEQVSRQLESLNPAALQNRIEALDRDIPALRLQLEKAEEPVEFVSRPHKGTDGLTVLYRRLDEIDNQIRRWRHVHGDVQQQRVQLKDEMVVWNQLTLDSSGHPYHRTREILGAIEAKVGSAENSVVNFGQAQAADSAAQANQMAQRITDLCGQIRQDLYALCDELGSQYRHVRHRSAAAELKRLRRCYDEISQNIDALIEQRQSVFIELRTIDPVGADVIVRNEHDFCHCAQHEGYLQARRKFVGEPAMAATSPTAQRPDTTLLRSRLAELQDLRAARVRELVAAENQFRSLDGQRQSLIAQRQEFSSMSIPGDLQSQFQQVNQRVDLVRAERMELQRQIDRDAGTKLRPANTLLTQAATYAQRLTAGAIHNVWLSTAAGSPYIQIEAENGRGHHVPVSGLPSDLQQQLVLALRLAIVDDLRTSGRQFPMILDEVAAGLTADLQRTTMETVTTFCQRGNQVLLLTSDQSLVASSRHSGVQVFELPDTTIAPPVPAWTPDRTEHTTFPRQPEFLTPFTTRRHAELATQYAGTEFTTYPMVKYPPSGQQIDYSIENFEDEPEFASPATRTESNRLHERDSHDAPISIRADLTELELLDASDLDRLQRLNIYRIEQLLAVNPDELPIRFLDAHISAEQLNQWQSMAWLMVCVPGLTGTDTQILHAIGIQEPEQLDTSNSQQLLDRVQRYLGSPVGRRYASRQRNFDRDRINRWFDSLDRTRNQWRLSGGYSRRHLWSSVADSLPNRGPAEIRSYDRSRHRDWRPSADRNDRAPAQLFERPTSSSGNSLASRAATARASTSPDPTDLKFYLNLEDTLEVAPSIGPKTAERFAKIGVLKVADFLAQTAESMATKIRYKRISADVIREWQNQARMVCRVPNLRGHDAQLLVACGIIEPEDLASRQPAKLYAIVKPFADSKEGLKMIRGGRKPDLQEVSNWINWARDTRSLQAA